MTSRHSSIPALIFFLVLSHAPFAQMATIKEDRQTMKTYPFSDPNPLPGMAISRKAAPFYPYFMIDGYTSKGKDQQWKVVTLENNFIKVTVLPEVGGKVLGAIEKSTGKEFVYWNHAMKFRAIGIRGPWTSGGIEHNFGLDLGHAPWAAGPVDYQLINNPDSSVSCVVGGLDLASRSEWRVKINLPKDKAYFETEALWFNPLPLHQAYLSWENAAFKASDDLRFFFPGNHHIGHDGLASPWPIDSKGRDLSYYKNNNFGDSKSYHVVGDSRNWCGGYWKNSDFGFGHWSSYADAPGKKLWIWSLSREGAIWEDLLTDKDGQYIEAQSGVKLNQAAERSGYHSPFRQLSHKPVYGETKTDYWFPVKETGAMVDANPYGTLNVEWRKDSLYVTVSPLQQIEDTLVVSVDQNTLLSQLVKLQPMKTFRRSFGVPASKNIIVSFGNHKLYYSGKQESIVFRPVVANDSIKDFNSGEWLFRMAEEQNAMRNFSDARILYQQCVEKEPTHSEALARLAELSYRSGQYEKGIDYARSVLAFSAYDGAANYIYGALQDKLNHPDDAEEAFSIASRTMEFRSAAYSQIAGIELKKKNFEQAALYAKKALDYNIYNLTAATRFISASRKLNKRDHAGDAIKTLLQIDPLNQYAKFEKYLYSEETTAKKVFQDGIQNEFPQETYLELAIQYASTGMNEEAIKVLELAPAYPIVYYWLAYLYKDSDKQKSDAFLARAESISPWLVFPFRPETLPVLEWAQHQKPSWKTLYYCGLIFWNNNDLAKAKASFDQCGQEPDYAPFYLSRGILLNDDIANKKGVLYDFLKAVRSGPKEWRTWSTLSNFYESGGAFEKQVANAAVAYKQFPDNPVIRVDYARALLNVKQPLQCINVLGKTLILPQEGAKEGHEIFEMANISQALINIKNKQYREAIKFLTQAKLFPEALGEGKPYDPDYRLINYMLAYCEKKSGRTAEAEQYEQDIISFTSDSDKFNATRSAGSNYIGTLIMDRHGKSALTRPLIQGWKHFQDSLATWQISSFGITPQMQWVLAKQHDPLADTKALEQSITGNGKENQFTLFLKALDLVEEKK
jgi:tetratricopeptide (TPR) repeat protein